MLNNSLVLMVSMEARNFCLKSASQTEYFKLLGVSISLAFDTSGMKPLSECGERQGHEV